MSAFAIRSLPRPVLTPRRRVAPILHRAVGMIAREWHLWRAARVMQRLDDHVLNDLGLSRGDIDYTVRHGRPERPWR